MDDGPLLYHFTAPPEMGISAFLTGAVTPRLKLGSAAMMDRTSLLPIMNGLVRLDAAMCAVLPGRPRKMGSRCSQDP
jgi:hypothetical protein